ncbi:MAG: universal stress protein, partial [Gemmatimonadota bacterium]
MYRSVLVPLDGSHRSEWALPGAIGIARRQTAQIELMIVEPVIPVAPRFDGTISDGAEPWRNEADSAWLTYVTGIAERVKAVYPATVTSTVRVGRA